MLPYHRVDKLVEDVWLPKQIVLLRIHVVKTETVPDAVSFR